MPLKREESEMKIPENLLYTESHEWFDPKTKRMGLTDYAQSELGDLVFLQLNVEVGAQVEKSEVIGEIESVKAVSEIYMPLPGKIAEINSEVTENPEVINEDPYGRGWLLQLEPSSEEGLLTPEEYKKQIESE